MQQLRWIAAALCWLATFTLPAAASAQETQDPPTFNFLDQLGPLGGAGGAADGQEVTFDANYTIQKGSGRGELVLTAQLAPDWHIYSFTQQPGGPQKSQVTVASDSVRLTGPLIPEQPPAIKHYEFYPGLPVEEHSGRVTWRAPLQVDESFEPGTTAWELAFSGQVCQDDGVCILIQQRPIPVLFDGYTEDAAPGEYRKENAHVTVRGHIEAEPAVTSGQAASFELVLSAVPDESWHVYAYQPTAEGQVITSPTLIVLHLPDGWQSQAPQASAAPVRKETGIADQPWMEYYEGQVSWTIPISAPADIAAGQYTISGLLGYQVCTDSRCDLPEALKFSVDVAVGEGAGDEPLPLEFRPTSYTQVATAAAAAAPQAELASNEAAAEAGLNLDNLQIQDATADAPMALVLATAFAAGFILNFMPCVLPVIGLKVMAFVQQSGDNRGRVFMLNLWYSVGLMSVFLVLATLAVFAGLSWGQQFSSAGFNIVLASVVFAFALSFLGVWEIPIPGFVGSGKVGNLATKEGASGAFFKGVLTTILATPCSGPMLTPALTWAVGQTPAVAYAGFAAVGLGMASPYLLIGLFPNLVSFLPKPGAWMETFKHVMGFVLLGTVVFLLTFMPVQWVVPTLAFMIGLWSALWWVGRLSITASRQTKVRNWAGAVAFATAVGLFSFVWLEDVMESRFHAEVDRLLAERNAVETVTVAPAAGEHELPWQPFSMESLEQLTKQRKTVFIDFTADW